jgi:adenine-specific DNA-methyltransferase
MSKIKDELEKELRKISVFLDEESGDINFEKVKDSADSYDEVLLKALCEKPNLRKQFFKKVGDVEVFYVKDFKFFIDENRIFNSYTQFKNRIGLGNGNSSEIDDGKVVLDFPFKDCVLEGGQTKESGEDIYFAYDEKLTDAQKNKGLKERAYNKYNAPREEVFFNEVLAKDEIDHLLDKKAFTGWRRLTQKKHGPVKSLERNKEGLVSENLVIKGNNLLALSSIETQYANRVKLIYIDPPYNPQGPNNTFIYNNKFKRSTWLTFMKNRLDVAKRLLTTDGALVIAIDENEQAYLSVLLDEIFPDHEKHCITIVHNPRGVQGTNFSYTHEYAIFVFPKGKKVIRNRKIEEEDIKFRGLRDNGGESLRTDARNCFYPIIIDKCTKQVVDFGEVCKEGTHPQANVNNGDFVEIYPIDKNGIERKWRYARQSVKEVKDLLAVVENDGVYDIQIGKDFGQYKTVWIDKKYDANEYGTKLVKDLVPGSNFSFPKSLYNVIDVVYAVVADDKDAIVLDYHAGSGTTGHAVLELNKDGGNRKFILIEQMDYVETITAPRIKEVLKRNKSTDSFIYLELAKWNKTAQELIKKAKSLKELEGLLNTLCDKYFIDYNVKINEFKKIIKEEEFKNLSLNEQKKIFADVLDLNQMYVNTSEMSDAKFGINKEDQRLTKEFYK